ncbi:hypothetical protein [Arenibacterium sp. LLYu02]|uniref:hypothetical protein n=1 Tax=Arenibacterium sp. LLYu02 TaxID=3404132 RepID=UPI003B21471C
MISAWHAKALSADYELDLTDNWVAEVDPENEYGETCAGLFDVIEESGTNTLIGLRLEDGNDTLFCDRAYAIQMLGGSEVHRVELGLERGDFSFDVYPGEVA